MGANNSTRRVSFESDENDNVTIVKGIRLSENVINRMRESSGPHQTPSPPRPSNSITSMPSQSAPEPVASSAPPPVEPAPPVKPSPPADPVVVPPKADETELRRRRRISEELQRGLEEEKRRQDLQQWLEKERALLQAQDMGSRIPITERPVTEYWYHTAQNEKLRAQCKQLEDRTRVLKKQQAFYQEQVAKLQEQSTQLYKVTTENCHKAADEVNAKFKRYEISPVCADLQDQILKCYRENAGKTLHCSSIASVYLQCVHNSKQGKMSTGG